MIAACLGVFAMLGVGAKNGTTDVLAHLVGLVAGLVIGACDRAASSRCRFPGAWDSLLGAASVLRCSPAPGLWLRMRPMVSPRIGTFARRLRSRR